MMEEYIIREIAKDNFLDKKQEDLLVSLMAQRFPTERSPSYVAEWATRIVKGSAFAHADIQSRKVLTKFGVTE